MTNFYGLYGTDILEIDSNKLTGRLGYERDIGNSTLGYVSYTRGFKPAGSNLTYGRESEIAPIVVCLSLKKRPLMPTKSV